MNSKEWSTFTLRDISKSIAYGYTASAKYEPVGPKFLRITDIVGGLNWATVPYCEIASNDYDKYKLEVGDIVIARTGATTGTTEIIKEDKQAVFASYLIRFRIDETIADPFFIGHVLKSDSWKEFIKSSIGGSAQPGANANVLSQFEILLPPLPTQHRIAEILSALDDKIELNRLINVTLEAIAQAIFKEWFVDFHFPGATGEMIESELGLIPKGWRVGTVDDVVRRIPSGKKFDFKSSLSSGVVPILDQSHFKIIGYHNEEPGVIASTEFPVIVFSNHRCYTDIIQYSFSAIQNVLPFIGHNVDTRWLYYATDGIITYSEYKGHWPDFISKPLIIPPKYLTNAFGELTKPALIKTMENQIESQILMAIRDSLLPILMSGDIRIIE